MLVAIYILNIRSEKHAETKIALIKGPYFTVKCVDKQRPNPWREYYKLERGNIRISLTNFVTHLHFDYDNLDIILY